MILKAANRWQAFGLHLLISLVLFLLLAAIIYFWWYPGVLFRYDGGLEGMKLIAGVDFFIGPVLTLLVYKVGKKTLRFDLACIAVLQLACLSGGMWTVWQTRPVAVVYANHSFRSISSQVYADYGVVVSAVPALQTKWPVWLWTIDSAPVRNLFGEVQGNGRAHFAVESYLLLGDALPMLEADGSPAAQVTPLLRAEAESIAAGNPHVLFYRATLGAGSGYMALDPRSGQAVDFLPLLPREMSLLAYFGKSKVLVMDFINSLFEH
jgi:hypothetical protein